MTTRLITHVGAAVGTSSSSTLTINGRGGLKGYPKILKEVFFFIHYKEDDFYALSFASAKRERLISYTEVQITSHKRMRALAEPIVIDDEDVFVYVDQQGQHYCKHMKGERLIKIRESILQEA